MTIVKGAPLRDRLRGWVQGVMSGQNPRLTYELGGQTNGIPANTELTVAGNTATAAGLRVMGVRIKGTLPAQFGFYIDGQRFKSADISAVKPTDEISLDINLGPWQVFLVKVQHFRAGAFGDFEATVVYQDRR